MDELISFSHNFEGLRQLPSVSTANNLLKDSCEEGSYLEDSDVDSEDEDLDLDRQDDFNLVKFENNSNGNEQPSVAINVKPLFLHSGNSVMERKLGCCGHSDPEEDNHVGPFHQSLECINASGETPREAKSAGFSLVST
ncbi:hypothetical protein ILUMI_06067 [Ignelater luminosus]|uniref:Uncharacterized protein n=1 Tax=Ignelater luminosus TaxID=2038154 RepID=A0A8K0GHK2_IGNLU|nr:hypothetical protein ILUMI_06067 [Ignelater luminosus]